MEEKIRQLLNDSREIQNYLEIECSDDPNEVVERGNALAVYLARSAKMLADAKQIYNIDRTNALNNVIQDIVSHKYAKTIQTTLVDGLCNDSKYLVDLIERQNAAITHNLEWCRTMISKAKAEMQLSGMNR